MYRLFSSGLVLFAGVVSLPAGLSTTAGTVRTRIPAPNSRPDYRSDYSPDHNPDHSPDYSNDPRLHSLRSFFQKFGCPALEYAHVFLEAADNYKLDWRLLPSLSWVESSGGKAAPNNNILGWNSGRASFPSPAAAIHAVGYRLAFSLPYRHKKLDELLLTYNPNPEYVARVKSIMRRIAPGE